MNAQEYIAEEESLMRSTALERAKFIRKTYAHLALAILAFAAAEAMLMSSKGAVDFARQMSEYWLVALAIFMGLSALGNEGCGYCNSYRTGGLCTYRSYLLLQLQDGIPFRFTPYTVIQDSKTYLLYRYGFLLQSACYHHSSDSSQ